jgi:signal transduction histidine kinase
MRPKLGFTWWPDADLFYGIYIIYFYIGIAIAFYLMVKAYQKSQGIDRNRLRYFIPAAAIATIAGSFNYFLWYDIPIPPLLNPFITVYAIIVAYTILRHHLMDIDIVIRKGLIYSTLVGIVTGIYLVLLNTSNYLITANKIDLLLHIPMPAIPPLISSIAFILLGLLVFLRGIDRGVSSAFFLLCFFTFCWQFSWFILFSFPGFISASIMVKVGYSGIIFLPIALIHFLSNFFRLKEREKLTSAFYSIGGLFLALLWGTNYFINGYYEYSWGFYPRAGYIHPIFMLFFLSQNIIGAYIMGAKYYSSKDIKIKKQIQLFFIAFLIYCLAAGDFLPNYGIAFYPPGYLFILISFCILTYAIFKHHLIELIGAIKKGIFYSLIIGLITGIYLASIYLFSYLINNISEGFSLVLSSLLMILFAIFFQPLRDKIQEFIDKVFFRGKYDYQKTLKELSLVARSIAGLDELLDNVLTAIVNVIKLNNASVYVLDKRGGKYFARKTIGIDIKRALPENDDIIKLLASRKEAVMYDEISKTSGNISGFMKEIGAAIIFPIITKDELVGFLCLGEKLSGEVYSDEDIDLLTTLCNQMGVSIENAMLYEDALEAQKKLYQADKLATVGALAAGLAHEIKNPIAAIKGFSQVIGKAVEENDAEAIKDFKDVVPRQLDRINEIVEKLLTLSKPPKLERKKIDINVLLDEIVRLVEKQALKQRVEIVKSFEDLPQTLADPEQLTQAFLNLILNAIQSMPDGGQIEIRTRFMGTDRIVVEIIDNGAGIPKEKLSRIFDPFYTTKAGGSGLGLSVTQKIIIDHHGKIDVDSEVGKGTTFKIILPVTH